MYGKHKKLVIFKNESDGGRERAALFDDRKEVTQGV